jgi:aspartyl-tRNA(Asn)/glutamyl-tRNA(Gln) amidotransferase subunit A
MGRSAEDCALLFDAIVKYDPRDPNSVSGPPGKASASLIGGAEGRGPLSLQGMKLGVPSESFVAPLDPEVRAAWCAALLVLQEEGAKVIDVELQRPAIDIYRTIQMPEASLAHMERGWLTELLEAYGERTRSRLLQGQTIPAVDYLRAQQQRRAFSSNLRSIMQKVNALVLPTIPMPAILIEQADQDMLIDGVTENATVALLRMTMPFNLAGLPAISLPCGFTAGNLPIGLQIVGKPFEESMILRIAHAYQQLTDWHRREIHTLT